jgi:hypothetical protein
MKQEEEVTTTAETDSYPLDDAAIGALADLDTQERAMSAQINIARNATLSYFARIHKLQGSWKLAENRRELVRASEEPAAGGAVR